MTVPSRPSLAMVARESGRIAQVLLHHVLINRSENPAQVSPTTRPGSTENETLATVVTDLKDFEILETRLPPLP